MNIKDNIKAYVVNKGLQQAQAKIDTASEREQVTRVVVDGLHLPGLPKSYAWVLSIVAAAVNGVLEVLASTDPSTLMKDWHLYAHTVALALVGKFFLWMRQNSEHGTAVLEAGVVSKLNAVLPENQ